MDFPGHYGMVFWIPENEIHYGYFRKPFRKPFFCAEKNPDREKQKR